MRLIPSTVIYLSFFLSGTASFAAEAPPADPTNTCVDVQIGNDRTSYLNCLNEALQRQVAQEHAAPKVDAPINAHSSSTQVGTFNEGAARQQMGNAFGISAVPQRPARVFVSPIVPQTAH